MPTRRLESDTEVFLHYCNQFAVSMNKMIILQHDYDQVVVRVVCWVEVNEN